MQQGSAVHGRNRSEGRHGEEKIEHSHEPQKAVIPHNRIGREGRDAQQEVAGRTAEPSDQMHAARIRPIALVDLVHQRRRHHYGGQGRSNQLPSQKLGQVMPEHAEEDDDPIAQTRKKLLACA